MENQVKICPHCQTINEPDYVYCKRCGAALPNTGPNPQAGAPCRLRPAARLRAAGGRLRLFGTGYHRRRPSRAGRRLYRQQPWAQTENPQNGADAQQNLLELAGLSDHLFFGGVLLTPCWFFHRKMNKVAAILLIAGIIFYGLEPAGYGAGLSGKPRYGKGFCRSGAGGQRPLFQLVH